MPWFKRIPARALKALVALARPIGICAACGAALAFAYPTWNYSWLVWIALTPSLAALWQLVPGNGNWQRAKAAAICGWFAGFAFFLINLAWILEVSILGWIALCAYLAIYFALWAAVVATVGRPQPFDSETQSWLKRMFAPSAECLRVAIVCASAWTALEWIRGWMFSGFGWNGLGVALHENLVLIQIADVVGVTGISFVVVLVWSTTATTVIRLVAEIRHARIRPHADFFVVIGLIIGLFLYGMHRIDQHRLDRTQPSQRTINCLIIQPNVPQEVKWDELYALEILDQFFDATEASVTEDTSLVIWPETAIPYSLQTETTASFLTDVLGLGKFVLALGINDIQSDDDHYNAFALLKGDFASVRVYRKVHLVPFGEFIPFRESFPLFDWIAGSQITGDFKAGTETAAIPMPGSDPDNPTEIIPLICFEDTIGELARQFVSDRQRPQLLVTVTNNGWFHESGNALQHVANAKFRCIELRKPMLRSANTGVTCHIEPTGRIASYVHDPIDGSTFIGGALVTQLKLPSHQSLTFYARHGDLFSKILTGISIVFVLVFAIRERRRRSPLTSE